MRRNVQGFPEHESWSRVSTYGADACPPGLFFVICLFLYFSGLSLVYSHVNSIWLCLGIDLSVVFFVLAQARALAGEFVAVEQVSEPAQTSLHQNKLSRVTLLQQ